MTWVMLQQPAAEVDRVGIGGVGQLVDHHLGRIGGMGRADRTPPQHGHADIGRDQVDREVGDVVG